MSAHVYIYGRHAVQSLLKNQSERIVTLFVHKSESKNFQAILEAAASLNTSVKFISRQELDQLTASANHQGVAAFCIKQQVLTERDLKTFIKNLAAPILLLILDNVQDPHNLGACFRTAEAAGVQAIIAPRDRSVGVTATVSKVASGAAEIVPFFQVTNLVRTLTMLKEAGIWLYGADAEADSSLYTADLAGSIALVLGAEGSGLRHLTKESCDYLLRIPMQGHTASLNVSVAAGIFVFEAVRQRLEK